MPRLPLHVRVHYDDDEIEERLWIQSERSNTRYGALVSRRLAELYEKGCVDTKKRLMRRANVQSLANAEYILGRCFMDGRDHHEKCLKKCISWCRRAGRKLHMMALETVIASNEVGGKDPESIQSLLNAANADVVAAQYLLGKCYLDGRGSSKWSVWLCLAHGGSL